MNSVEKTMQESNAVQIIPPHCVADPAPES